MSATSPGFLPSFSVPEIDPPVKNATCCSTSWGFTYADQILGDFMASIPNVFHTINFNTTPDWKWGTDTPYTYPEDVNTID
ncbi:hypothetical protein N7532_010289 [Penicillium argentinense]|uniref:Uncharacterized protein n=1 Tax=Penicillium argentinense TaxID=1131581 RepID=A0A9W9EPB3_9EURO|nr:uncharacterized protein N7532_010289 [Penicillium argentinense]KAJ5085518.1 hypothetical protein N7532_010289 [Penicillium argentinense]